MVNGPAAGAALLDAADADVDEDPPPLLPHAASAMLTTPRTAAERSTVVRVIEKSPYVRRAIPSVGIHSLWVKPSEFSTFHAEHQNVTKV